MTAIRNSLYRTPCSEDDDTYKKFEDSFLYEPTIDQIRCFDAIKEDMVKKTRPMDRLICGDVGFGKRKKNHFI